MKALIVIPLALFALIAVVVTDKNAGVVSVNPVVEVTDTFDTEDCFAVFYD